jgi:hypothetical protein
MFEVKTSITEQRIEAIVAELRYVSSASFLSGLSLRQRAKEVLWELKNYFPVSAEPSGTLKEFGMSHLIEGFYEYYEVRSKGIYFGIRHELWDNDRARAILNSLDRGSRAFEYESPEYARFQDKRAGKRFKSKAGAAWVTIAPGDVIERSARPGHHYVSKTKAFINSHIIPALKQDFQRKVDSRTARLKNGELR